MGAEYYKSNRGDYIYCRFGRFRLSAAAPYAHTAADLKHAAGIRCCR